MKELQKVIINLFICDDIRISLTDIFKTILLARFSAYLSVLTTFYATMKRMTIFLIQFFNVSGLN